MAKVAPDAMIDASLAYVQACDLMVVCSAEPTSYADATATVDLADVALSTPADLVIANDTSGRKITIAAKSAVAIDHSGTATHIALCKVGDTTLRYVTTCTSQALTSGGTVDLPAFKINIADPT
jgi:hypothetical protein